MLDFVDLAHLECEKMSGRKHGAQRTLVALRPAALN